MVIFLLLMVSYGFLYNDYPPFSNRNFLPMCFGVIICLELFTQDKKTTFKDFIPILYIISAFGCLMALYARTGGSWIITDTTDISDVTHDYNSNDEDSAVFLFGEIGLANLAANLNLETRNKFLRLSRPILGIISFLLVLTSGKRTVTILFFLYIILWAYNKYTWNEINKKLYMIIPSVIFFIIVIIALSKLSFISTFFDSFEERFVNGVNIIFGGAPYVYEDSASTRLYMRAKFYNIISSPEFSFLNMLFGKGWMTLYMDCPLLQSYLDMGIIGFFLFIYNYIIRILKNLVYKPTNKDNNLDTSVKGKTKKLQDFFVIKERFLGNNQREVIILFIKSPSTILSLKEYSAYQSLIFDLQKQKDVDRKGIKYVIFYVGTQISEFARPSFFANSNDLKPFFLRHIEENDFYLDAFIFEWNELLSFNDNKIKFMGDSLKLNKIDTLSSFIQEYGDSYQPSSRGRLTVER